MHNSKNILNNNLFENFSGCYQEQNIPQVTNEIYDQGITTYNPNIPKPDVCIGPKCLLPQDKNFQKQKYIQNINSLNLTCSEEDNQCLDNIKNSYGKGVIYQTDNIGLLTPYETNIQPNQVNLYQKSFNKYFNKTPKINKKQMEIKPTKDAFELAEQCVDWCNKSYSCNAVAYQINDGTSVNQEERAGFVDCYYYSDLKANDLRNNEGSNVEIKRVNDYVTKVSDDEINKSWFNNNRPPKINIQEARTKVKKREKCLEESKLENFETPQPIKYGQPIYLLNLYDTPTYLTSCKSVDRGCDGYSGVKTNLTLKKNKSSLWYIVSAQNPPKNKGDIVKVGEKVRLMCKDGKGFLKICTHNQANSCSSVGTSTTLNKNKSSDNSDIWRFYYVNNQNNQNLYNYQELYIENDDTEKYLDVCGGANCGNNKYGVIRANQKNRDGNSGKWQILTPGKNACINTKYGCCPGTTIPKEVICQCSEEEINYLNLPEEEDLPIRCAPSQCRKTCTENLCKIIDERIFNCALSGRDVGDPNSYYDNRTNKYTELGSRRCLTSDDCVIDERCINNTCLKVDPNYYNTLLGGGLKMADLSKNSGPNIMRFRFQESFENKRDWWNYRNFLFFIIFGIVITALFFRIVRRK